MATLSPNRIPSNSMGSSGGPSLTPSDGKKRAVTLSRVATTSANSSPVKTPLVPERSDFTRVRRVNTLRYVISDRPPRTKISKSRSLSGSTSSYYKKYTHDKYNSNKKKRKLEEIKDSSPIEDQHGEREGEEEGEGEIQEFSLHLISAESLSSSCSSNEGERGEGVKVTLTNQDSEQQDEEEDDVIICSKCSEVIGSNDSFILFGTSSLHVDCFKCGECHHPMGTMEVFLVNVCNEPLCIECTPTCHLCNEKILQNHISVLKKDFHEECLCCVHCRKKFSLMAKVYASDGEPCCSKCVSPVFSEQWSPTKPRCLSLNLHPQTAAISSNNNKIKVSSLLSPSPSTDSGVSETASGGGGDNDECHIAVTNGTVGTVSKLPEGVSLNPRLENLSRSITLYSSNNHSGLKASYSEPNLYAYNSTTHTLQSILCDEDGVVLFVNYCTNNDLVEYIVFWLDVEHFKHFDGSSEDLRIFAHHIITKYVGYYAEVPVALPSHLQRSLFDKMEEGVSQDMFNESQDYVYYHMQNEILSGFIQSSDGQAYLQILNDKGITKITSHLHLSNDSLSNGILQTAVITNFDKRRIGTKFYVYEIEVTKDIGKYFIYRRYSEWYSLNQSLRKAFPLDKFPPLPKKIFLGRSQKKTVAQQRMTELQVFLQGVLGMSTDIVHSVILKKFFKQSEMDKEDEQFNYRIKQLQTRRPS